MALDRRFLSSTHLSLSLSSSRSLPLSLSLPLSPSLFLSPSRLVSMFRLSDARGNALKKKLVSKLLLLSWECVSCVWCHYVVADRWWNDVRLRFGFVLFCFFVYYFIPLFFTLFLSQSSFDVVDDSTLSFAHYINSCLLSASTVHWIFRFGHCFRMCLFRRLYASPPFSRDAMIFLTASGKPCACLSLWFCRPKYWCRKR